MLIDSRVLDNLTTEDSQSQLVHRLYPRIRHEDPVHVHQDVPDHHHGSCMVRPRPVEHFEEAAIDGVFDCGSDLRENYEGG